MELKAYKMTETCKNMLKVGDVLNNKWVILGFIDKGGMGEVYRAHQSSLNRDVAIKVISREWLESIDEGDVENIVGRSVTDTVFKLVDAIERGDTGWAMRILGDLYSQKKNVTEVIGYLTWHIRLIAKIKYFSRRGMRNDEIAREAAAKVYQVSKMRPRAESYKEERVVRWTQALLTADREIKKGLKEPFLAMDILISSLIA